MHRTFLNTSMIFASAVLGTALTSGCATMRLQTNESESRIRAAEEAGAKEIPEASLYLQLANEGLAEAERLNEQDEHEKATSMLTRAEADAELARLLSRESGEKAEAQAAIERVNELRRANNPTSK